MFSTDQHQLRKDQIQRGGTDQSYQCYLKYSIGCQKRLLGVRCFGRKDAPITHQPKHEATCQKEIPAHHHLIQYQATVVA